MLMKRKISDFLCNSVHCTCTTLYHISSVIRLSFFPFQNNPKDLDPSYKMFMKGKTHIMTKFHRTDLVI